MSTQKIMDQKQDASTSMCLKVCPFNIFPMIKHIPNVKINSVLIYLNLSLPVWKNELVKIMIKSQFDARHEKQTISFFSFFFLFFKLRA